MSNNDDTNKDECQAIRYIKSKITSHENFPKKGIVFRDIFPGITIVVFPYFLLFRFFLSMCVFLICFIAFSHAILFGKRTQKTKQKNICCYHFSFFFFALCENLIALRDPRCLEMICVKFIDHLQSKYGHTVDAFVGLDSRGFLFGPILAFRMGCAFGKINKTKQNKQTKNMSIAKMLPGFFCTFFGMFFFAQNRNPTTKNKFVDSTNFKKT